MVMVVLVSCGRTEPLWASDDGVAGPGHHDAGVPDAGPPDAGARDAGLCVPWDDEVAATLHITADNRRRVWVNGVLVEAPDLEWDRPTVTRISLFRHPARENVVAVEGTNLTSQAGFDRGVIFDVALNGSVVVSDGSWRVRRGAQPDTAWTLPGFDDSGWAFATIEASNGEAPWGRVTSVSPAAKWLWSYASDVAFKPDHETAVFRRRVWLTLDGRLGDVPSACP
ncbi:MAG: hypothetical protein ACOZQL_01060 [Myxococcota bacterium]